MTFPKPPQDRTKKMEFAVSLAEKELIQYCAEVFKEKTAEHVRSHQISCALHVLMGELSMGREIPEFSEKAQEFFTDDMKELYSMPAAERKERWENRVKEVKSRKR